jgi:hypothetical protein
LVNTNEFGQANCTVARFDDPRREQVVRATLVYQARGFSYEFADTARDFVYSPPLRRASIVVLERSPLGASVDPYVTDPVFRQLESIDFDFSLYNGALSPEAFARVYNGDLKAIEALGLDEDVSYLVVVLSDCYGVRQIELNGRKFNLFVSDARATLRIVRTADAKILYQKTVERAHANGKHGQGGTEEKAAQDVLRAISEELAAEIAKERQAVATALAGSEAPAAP